MAGKARHGLAVMSANFVQLRVTFLALRCIFLFLSSAVPAVQREWCPKMQGFLMKCHVHRFMFKEEAILSELLPGMPAGTVCVQIELPALDLFCSKVL